MGPHAGASNASHGGPARPAAALPAAPAAPAVLANGRGVAQGATARPGANITVQATPWQNSVPVGAVFTTPYLRIRVEQRRPTTPQLMKDPLLANWLDV